MFAQVWFHCCVVVGFVFVSDLDYGLNEFASACGIQCESPD